MRAGSHLCMDTLRFPPEVLFKIFLHSLEYDYHHHLRFYPEDPPLLLTRVCRYWREVAMSGARLWTFMSLPDIPPSPHRCDLLFKQVPFWLSLSRSLPITFYLSLCAANPARAAQYVEILLGEIHRWKVVGLSVGLIDVNLLPTVKPGSMVLLEKLIYSGHVALINDTPPSLMTSLMLAPRLRQVSLEDDMPTAWALPWANLTNFDLQFQSYSHPYPLDIIQRLCESLSACIHLSILTVTISLNKEQDFLQSTVPILLPNLLDFTLNTDMMVVAKSFLQTGIVAPQLNHFHLIFPILERHIIGGIIMTFLSPHGDQLESLWLREVSVSTDDFINILKLVPKLHSLDFSDTDVNLAILDALTLRFSPEGRLLSGQNLHLQDICCVPLEGLEECDITQMHPVLPLSIRAPHQTEAERLLEGSDFPDEITYIGDPIPLEEDATEEILQDWLSKVSDPEFCIGFARMIGSRWDLPSNAEAGGIKQIIGARLVYFDLHIVECVAPEWYANLLRYWQEGLDLNVWCSLTRQTYWRQNLHYCERYLVCVGSFN